MDEEEQVTQLDPDAGAPAQPPIPPETLMLYVQALKGAPASVLLALAMSGRYMSHKELQLWTRCGKDQVTFALRSLVRLGWAACVTSRGPWILAHALPVPSLSLLAGESPFKGLSSSSDSLNLSYMKTILLSPARKELVEAMYGFGIREPTASELAELPHMSLEYVRAHVEGARALGLKVGSAIEAMRLAASPPMKPSAADRQTEVEEKIRRFREGG